MKNLSKTLAVLACGLLSCSFFCQRAQATPTTGLIEFKGKVTLTNPDAMTSMLVFDSVTITNATGIYASLETNPPTAADFVPVTINDKTHKLPTPTGMQPFINIPSSDFFFIEPEGRGSARPSQGISVFSIIGTTRAEGDGIPVNTFGFFQFSGSGTGNHIPFTGRVVVAPDAGSAVVLLGIALLGLEGLRRKLPTS